MVRTPAGMVFGHGKGLAISRCPTSLRDATDLGTVVLYGGLRPRSVGSYERVERLPLSWVSPPVPAEIACEPWIASILRWRSGEQAVETGQARDPEKLVLSSHGPARTISCAIAAAFRSLILGRCFSGSLHQLPPQGEKYRGSGGFPHWTGSGGFPAPEIRLDRWVFRTGPVGVSRTGLLILGRRSGFCSRAALAMATASSMVLMRRQ